MEPLLNSFMQTKRDRRDLRYRQKYRQRPLCLRREHHWGNLPSSFTLIAFLHLLLGHTLLHLLLLRLDSQGSQVL